MGGEPIRSPWIVWVRTSSIWPISHTGSEPIKYHPRAIAGTDSVVISEKSVDGILKISLSSRVTGAPWKP